MILSKESNGFKVLKNLIMSLNKCRICMNGDSYVNIYQVEGLSLIASQIMSIAKVIISPDDGLPNTICTVCLRRLNYCIEFQKLCEETDLKLRSLLHNNSEEENDTCYSNDKIIYDNDESYSDVQVSLKGVCKTNKQRKKQQCSTCGKIMSSRFRLKTHLITHTGERPFSCPHCSKRFSLEQNLKVHLRVHTGEKPLQCPICGKSFAQSAGLAVHKRKHSGEMPYQCVLCPRSFRTFGHLQYHTRRHTGEKNFECDTCGKAFITRNDLKQHILTHTGDRPHVCCVCGARMTRASHLKRHMQHAHQGQVSCNISSATFRQKAERQNNRKTHSSVESSE